MQSRWGQSRTRKTLLEAYASRLGVVVPRHQAELALLAAKQDAEKANKAKSEFLANMSHELRTPLNAILGFSEIIAAQLAKSAEHSKVAEYAGDIHSSGKHLLSLIEEVLDLSKIEAGKLELSKSDVDFAELVGEIQRLFQETAASASILLNVEIIGQPPTLVIDRTKIKQVLLNLISNAIKFTPEGGRVTLRANFQLKEAISIEVEDTGIGMSDDEIPMALTPFQQIEDCLTKKFEGTGLGLPIAKAFTELHDGRLTIRSEPGVGTCVRLRFPHSCSAEQQQQVI